VARVDAGRDWLRATYGRGEGLGATITGGRRMRVQTPKLRFTPGRTAQDMDVQGIDVQIVSITRRCRLSAGRLAWAASSRAEVNDEIAGMGAMAPALRRSGRRCRC